MKHSALIRFPLAAALAAARGLVAQPAAPSPSAHGTEETVVLNPFEVTGTNVGRYQASEALAGGRLAESLFDTTDDISIVTSDFIQDTSPRDIFNAVKYLAGISNNSSQTAGDRVSIRGFQVSSPDIDGFDTVQSVVKNDPALYESVEFVRGPDSLLAPNGSPGGTLNLVSKVAKFENFGSLTGQVGRYDTNAGNFDYNRVVAAGAAFRLVGSFIDATQGDNQGYHESVGIEPSVLFKIGDNSRLLLHATWFWGTAYNYLGLPIDPASRNGTDQIRLLPGLNAYETPYADSIGDASSANHADRMIYRAVFTSKVNDNLSVRLAGRYMWDWETNNQWNLTGNAGGGYDPYTGWWTPGLVWTGNATAGFASAPAPAISPVYPVSQSPTNDLDHYVDAQNDWVYHLKGTGFDSTTSAGAAVEMFQTTVKGFSAASPAINVYAIPNPATWTPSTKPVTDQDVQGNWEQLYLNEKLKVWDDRLTLNASAVPTWFTETVTNFISGVASSSVPHPTFVNYGAAFAPVPAVALYYGHSADAAQISPPSPPTPTNPNPPQLQSGKQDEAGVRFRFLDGRLSAHVAYYQLYQTNNAIVNPALFSVPPPTVTPPNIYADRVARGWEFETNMTLTPSLSLLANYTSYTNRSPYNIPFRMNPEKSGAVYANYRFADGALNGLSVGIGYVAQSRAAGDSATGVTAASTPTNVIPFHPSFYIPGYGLVNVNAAYRFDPHWIVRVYVDNLFNTTYYAGALNANAVMPGIPINPHLALTYSF